MAAAELPSLQERRNLGILTPSEATRLETIEATGTAPRWGRRCVFFASCNPGMLYQQITDHDPSDPLAPTRLAGHGHQLD